MHARAVRRGTMAGCLALATLITALLAPTDSAAQPVGAHPEPSVIAIAQHPSVSGVLSAQHPLMVKVRGYDAHGKPLLASGAPGGYTAAELRAAVGLLGTGKGQTVAGGDALEDPEDTTEQ